MSLLSCYEVLVGKLRYIVAQLTLNQMLVESVYQPCLNQLHIIICS